MICRIWKHTTRKLQGSEMRRQEKDIEEIFPAYRNDWNGWNKMKLHITGIRIRYQ